MSSAAVAAWAERALGFNARASVIFAAAEASSSAIEASRPSANCASSWRRWWCSLAARSVAQRLAVFSASRSPASTVVKGIWATLSCMSAGISAQKGAKCCIWGGRDRAVAMGEGGRCPQERPGPGPEAARMASVAIEDVAPQSMKEGGKGDPEFAGGGAPEVVAEVACPLAVALVVVIVGF